MDLLQQIADRQSPPNLGELVAESGLTRPTVYRLVAVLQAEQMIAQTADKRYKPGLRLVSLARNALADIDIRRIARAELEQLRDATGETVHLAIRSGDELVYIDKIESHETVRMIQSTTPLDENQIQPASLDLRLGHKAYRVRASFLPGKGRSVLSRIEDLTYAEIDLEKGAVLERNCVYIIELLEHLDLPESISALANPKSSTGRLDIFTRVIANEASQFDFVPAGYQGKIYAEVCPRTFSVMVRTGSRLSQLRFRRRAGNQDEHADFRLSDRDLRERHSKGAIVDGPIAARGGLLLSVHLAGADEAQWAGFRAQTYTDVIDVDRVGAYSTRDFWEPIPARPDQRLILDPHQFYILASKERMRVPSDLAAEMVPIDPSMAGRFVSNRNDQLAPDVRPSGGTSVSVVAKSVHADFVAKYFPDLTVAPYNDTQSARQALKDGLVDLHFGDALSLSFWLQSDNADRCCGFYGGAYFDETYFGGGLSIALPKESTALKSTLNYALQRLVATGKFSELYLRYFPITWY